ncbi:MAG: DHHA1 domain-containing protein [Candidatus Aenigmatarchaeota archaeon]
MKELIELINKASEKIKSTNSLIQVIGHLDSVTGDNELLVEIDNRLRRMRVDELFDFCSLNFNSYKRFDRKIISNPKSIRVFSLDKNGKIVLTNVRSIIKHRTKKKIYEVKTKIGSVKVTEDHSLITLKNNNFCAERPTKLSYASSPIRYSFGNLNPHINLLDFKSILADFEVKNDFIELKHHKKIRIPLNIVFDENILCFFGMWIADGSYSIGKRGESVNISCYDDNECKNIIDYVFKIFGNGEPRVVDNGITAMRASTTLSRLMKLLGFTGYSNTKRVPEWIFSLKENLMAAFLRGYFSGDGTVSKGDINVFSLSKGLIKDIQTLLLFFGIRACVRKDKNGYKLSINTKKMKRIFLEKIGFLQQQKNAKVKIGKKSNYQDYIPIEKELIKELRKENIPKSEKDNLLRCLKNGKLPTRYRLSKICSYNIRKHIKSLLLKLIDSNVFWEEVKTNLISLDKEVDVYDIETENGNFVCENLVLKNTDGICSASLIASMLMELDKTFQITIVKGIKPEIINEIKKRKPELVIFTDIGSGYLDLLKELNCEIIVIDHHEIEGSSEGLIHINPLNFDLELSGSGTAYLLVKEILQHNSLAPLAIVGTIGDVNYSVNSKLFETPQITVETGLNLFGRFSRPLYKALELSGIPDLGEPSKAIQFLSEIGIKPQKNGEWRTLSDLTVEEKRKLADAIVKESLKHEKFKKEMIFGDVLTLKQFPDELKDAKEFATMLNACSNMNEPAIGIALCLGSKKALEYARGIANGYRKLIGNYLRWVEGNPSCIKQKDFAIYILAGDNINENMIGTIVSMLFKPSEKTLIGLANSEDGIKVSARAKDVNIRDVLVEAAKACGGSAGGHKYAAGATIPKGTEEKFIESCEKTLKERIKNVKT